MKDRDVFCAIWMVTYNHEKYISKALESVIRQEVNFKIKIFISDDRSTDKTISICETYVQEYPEKIELVINDSNIGPEKNGLKTYYRCFRSAAKYIALLEGDDYWLDENKLQVQVDFLEANSEYVGCFHNTEERYEDDSKKASFLYCNLPSAKDVTFQDLSYGNIIPTCSVVFRNNLFEQFPEWYKQMKMGDWPLHLINAHFGNYWYIPKVMAVHRLHDKSLWMLQDSNRNNNFVIEAYDLLIIGFEEKKIYSEHLIKAKDSFLNKMKLGTQKVGFTKRLKKFAIRMIEKL